MGTRDRSIAHAVRDFLVVFLLTAVVALPASAQFPGPPSTTVVNGHPLAPPPSVTSIAGQHLPNALPSVTSIPNMNPHFTYGQYPHGYYHPRGYGYGGYGYSIPYYYPIDNSAYGYDYVGGSGAGPDLYSGPPLGPNDPTYHMIVEQPPARPYGDDVPPPAYASRPPAPEPQVPPPADVKPGEPTVLVFHTGKQQEVTNYAIMGDSLYVFDQGRKKIALADLDITATIKANDDRGLEFRMPPSARKKATAAPQTSSPDQNENAKPPANIATAMP